MLHSGGFEIHYCGFESGSCNFNWCSRFALFTCSNCWLAHQSLLKEFKPQYGTRQAYIYVPQRHRHVHAVRKEDVNATAGLVYALAGFFVQQKSLIGMIGMRILRLLITQLASDKRSLC